MKLNKTKVYSGIKFYKQISFCIFFVILTIFGTDFLSADESFLKDIEINSSTKEDNSSNLPTNPFEIVEMIKKINSMNDATKPSDAIDDALKSFYKIEQKEKI